MKRAELLARIKAQLRVKTDATWVQSIVKGVLTEDSEAMKILESILPESIIARIQVSLNLCSAVQVAVSCTSLAACCLLPLVVVSYIMQPHMYQSIILCFLSLGLIKGVNRQ